MCYLYYYHRRYYYLHGNHHRHHLLTANMTHRLSATRNYMLRHNVPAEVTGLRKLLMVAVFTAIIAPLMYVAGSVGQNTATTTSNASSIGGASSASSGGTTTRSSSTSSSVTDANAFINGLFSDSVTAFHNINVLAVLN